MSYILDALRRADSERERGAVPSIHAPPVPPVLDDPKPSRGQPKALVAVIVVLLLALAALLAWHLMGSKEAPAHAVAEGEAAPTQAEAPPQMPPAQPAQQAQATQQMAPAPPPMQAPAMMQPPPAFARTAPPSPPPQALRQTPPTQSPSLDNASPVVTVPARPAAPSSLTTAAAPTIPAPVATPQADTRVYAFNELPANIQRDLPKLVVGGAMYSDTPANRMLIINSQVFHEGDKLTSDLLLQEIKLKSAVFQYKGYRYSVNY